ncbi:MAG TPA: hypothetical protein VF527_04500 [Pyrinomonadaceae bacterium]|jgi:hypothetical protein
MQWSKLKSRVKEFICPELSDRIDFYVTSYRESHDEADKVWITVDGRRVFCCKHYPHHRAEVYAYHCGLTGESVKSVLREVEIFHPKDFGDAMRAYLDMPVRDALKSPDPFVKAFALVDRRVGRRTFAKLRLSESEHELVKTFYELRRTTVSI